MKIKYLIIGVCLISFTITLSAQESIPFRGADGYKWKELGQNETLGKIRKMDYIAGLSEGAFNVFYGMAQLKLVGFDQKLLAAIIEQKNVNESQLKTMNLSILYWQSFMSDYNYTGVSFGQYISGLDEFYNDSNNMKIPIFEAMGVIKKMVKGEPKEEIEEQIQFLRSRYST